ncbi:aminoglycoside phosphotransferase family protein [Actinoplanes sp. NPDC051411]|uniref:aminoglycoside phosphotransferase family protein n=1 Tax=Actinoplanes sp. NPDC051411 TaxID=3155522 RepID=UPI0034348BF9
MFPVDAPLARQLIDTQFPQWSGLPLRRLDPAGSDHVIYRLGAELSARFPRHPGAVGQAAKEAAWLPVLAPHLPLTVPVPVAVGRADFGYPWSWGVPRWLPGTSAEGLGGSVETALTLAGFLSTLQSLPVPPPADDWPDAGPLAGRDPDTDAGPLPGRELDADAGPLPGRELDAGPLAGRDEVTRAAITELAGFFDAAVLTRVWEEALEAPPWGRAPVWFHGDFHTGNLLAADGRLSAVIDFGGLGVGDPATDLQIAYTLLEPAPRAAFRAALDLDEATWARGRGWTLTGGLLAHRAYAAGDARIAAQTTRQITAALADAAPAAGHATGRPAYRR